MASLKSSMLSILITSSTNSCFSCIETDFGCRSIAENRKASRHCRGLEVEILLLNIACLPLERSVEGLAIDEHVTAQHTNVCTLREAYQAKLFFQRQRHP